MPIIDILKTLPPELVTFFLAMLPVGELRTAIPFGMTVLKMDPWLAFSFALAGNIFVSLLIIFFLDPVTKFLRKHSKQMDKFIDWLFHRTRTKHTKNMSELGHIALVIFVAIPLPGSGAWSGSLVAYLFGVKSKAAIPLISLGLTMTGVFITFGTDFLIYLFR